MRWGWVGLLGMWGAGMGGLSAAVHVAGWQSAGLWVLGACLQIVVALWLGGPPMRTVLAASVVSGVLYGAVQIGLSEQVVAHEVGLPTAAGALRAALLSRGLVTGFLVGVVAGGLASGAAEVRRRRAERPVVRGK